MSAHGTENSFASPERQRIFTWIVVGLCIVYVARLGYLQIVQGSLYRTRAEGQAIKQLKVEPFRGTLYDRDGRAIVRNAPGFSITITPYECTPESITQLASILDVPDSVIAAEVRTAARYNRFAAAKLAVGRDVDVRTVSLIEERSRDLPGVDVIVDPKRLYDFEGNGAHLLGYTREVDQAQLQRLGNYYVPGDITGQTGLEKAYEAVIRGRKGYSFISVNKTGQRVESFNNGKSDIAPIEGNDLYLGIHTGMQELGERLLAGRRGGIVALDPNNGEIMTFVSKPDYDLRTMSGRGSRAYFNKLWNDPEKPLFNRASMPSYPPGSTWKMLVALGCLQEGLITEKTALYCAGAFTYGNRSMACHGAHGATALAKAIQVSCNSYFAQCGMKLKAEGMHKYGKMFRFGMKTMADITEESRGLLPSRPYMDRRYGKRGWTEYAFANWGIGQGEVTVTPLQMAMYTAALANGGTLYQPHAARAVYDKVLKRKENFSYASYKVPIDAKYFESIREAMYMVVNVPGGTASNGKVNGVEVCGKTGTAQNPHGQDHSWFVCFAPRERPVIAMCVMVENAGFGATVAVPIAQKLLDLYFNRQWPADTPRDTMRSSQDSAALVRTQQTPSSEPTIRGPFGIEAPKRAKPQATGVISAVR